MSESGRRLALSTGIASETNNGIETRKNHPMNDCGIGQPWELAATAYGLTKLRARVTLDNPASRKVLEHNGFVAAGSLTLNGKPAISYICELR